MKPIHRQSQKLKLIKQAIAALEAARADGIGDPLKVLKQALAARRSLKAFKAHHKR